MATGDTQRLNSPATIVIFSYIDRPHNTLFKPIMPSVTSIHDSVSLHRREPSDRTLKNFVDTPEGCGAFLKHGEDNCDGGVTSVNSTHQRQEGKQPDGAGTEIETNIVSIEAATCSESGIELDPDSPGACDVVSRSFTQGMEGFDENTIDAVRVDEVAIDGGHTALNFSTTIPIVLDPDRRLSANFTHWMDRVKKNPDGRATKASSQNSDDEDNDLLSLCRNHTHHRSKSDGSVPPGGYLYRPYAKQPVPLVPDQQTLSHSSSLTSLLKADGEDQGLSSARAAHSSMLGNDDEGSEGEVPH